MKNIFYFILALTLLVSASCSKEAGPEGPAGTRGDRGDQGEAGAQGIPGTDGNLILYGNAAPAATLGKLGDFYINKANSNLYGPKTASGWGAAVSMRGATGATGAQGVRGTDGSQFLSGTVAPVAGIGKPGDFYFNTATGQLFGPKNTNNTWAAGISLKGPKGDKGDIGAKGNTGAQGVRGTDGNLILSGVGVPAPTLGKVGDYYIDKTNLKLYGPKVAGGWGTASDMRGATGGVGATGTAGSQIFSGAAAPAAGTGKPGDFYFNTTTGVLHGPKNTNNTWGAGVSLKGPKGDPGTANVIYSDFTVSRTGTRDTTIDGSKMKFTHLVESKITSEVMESGTVLVYFRYNSDIFPIPYTSFAGEKLSTMNFFLKPGRIYITRFTHDNSASTPLPTILKYRYIIIPGGLKANLNGVNLGNYEDVKAALNVK